MNLKRLDNIQAAEKNMSNLMQRVEDVDEKVRPGKAQAAGPGKQHNIDFSERPRCDRLPARMKHGHRPSRQFGMSCRSRK